MRNERWPRALLCAAVLAGLSLAGCESDMVRVAPTPPAQYQKLASAEGSACGTMLLGPTAYNVIPAGLNDRVQRAYDNAVKSVPDATALVDVTTQESWYFWVIGTTRCTTIKGEAVK